MTLQKTEHKSTKKEIRDERWQVLDKMPFIEIQSYLAYRYRVFLLSFLFIGSNVMWLVNYFK